MERAHGYARVSTLDQELGLLSQDKAITLYCQLKELELVNIYTDHGTSGKHPLAQRPRGNAMIKALRKGDHVVIHKLDRAWRNARDCLQTVEIWDAMGINLHIVDMGMDLSTPMGRCFLTISAAFAEMERNVISQRTKEGLAQCVKPLGNRPYGEHPGEPETLRLALWLRRQGYSVRRVARVLDKIPAHKSRSGKPWDPEVLRRIMARASAS